MHVAEDHWLTAASSGLPPVLRVPSVRSGMLAADLRGAPLGLVWHWTGGRPADINFAKALAEEIRTFNRASDRAASWHILIAKDGTIIQSLPTNVAAWHVGKPGRIGSAPKKHAGQWDWPHWGGRLFANVNQATVGVELVNAGRLEKVGEKFFCWPFWLDPDHPASGADPKLEVEASRAVLHAGTWYDDFPKAQEMASARVVTALMLKYRWSRDVCRYGHVMFDQQRKEDPGPLWLEVVLPRVLDMVFGPE